MARKWVEIDDCLCITEKPAALRVEIDGEEVWIPRSQISEESEVLHEGDEGTLIITEFIAMEKGLI